MLSELEVLSILLIKTKYLFTSWKRLFMKYFWNHSSLIFLLKRLLTISRNLCLIANDKVIELIPLVSKSECKIIINENICESSNFTIFSKTNGIKLWIISIEYKHENKKVNAAIDVLISLEISSSPLKLKIEDK